MVGVQGRVEHLIIVFNLQKELDIESVSCELVQY